MDSGGPLWRLFERLTEHSWELLLFFAMLVLAVAVIIRIGVLMKSIFCKKSTNQFRTLLMFRKWAATALDLMWTALIVGAILKERGYHQGMLFFIALLVGIRIALYFAIRAEEKKK